MLRIKNVATEARRDEVYALRYRAYRQEHAIDSSPTESFQDKYDLQPNHILWIEDRELPGHWERDLLFGRKNSQIAPLVERHTRYVMLVKVARKDTETVINALIKKRSQATLPVEQPTRVELVINSKTAKVASRCRSRS